jgi:hypothetical protein
MRCDEILTKNFLTEKLLSKKMSLAALSNEVNITKLTLIRYCKKRGIYDEVRSLRSFVYGRSKDLTGSTIGKLTVYKRGRNDPFGKFRWLCRCECGKIKLINAASLIRKLSKSCGQCARGNFTGYEDVSGVWLSKLRKSALRRGISFNITAADVWRTFIKQNKVCELSGVPVFFIRNGDKSSMQTASIDRIDSSLGYSTKNIQIVHKRVNRIKSILGNEEFLAWCKQIYMKNSDKIKDIKEFNVEKLGWNDR